MTADRFFCVGPPGAGKTTFIAHEVQRALDADYQPTDIDVRSLTKAAARQAVSVVGLPEECVGTLHSAAFKALGLTKDQVAESKIHEFNAAHPHYAIAGGKPNLDDEGDIAETLNGSILHAAMNRSRLRMEPIDNDLVQEFAGAWHSWMREAQLIDFVGMLERAITDTYTMPGSPRVMFIDEAQDLSRLGLTLVAHWADKADKLVLAGDPVQSIYRWAGAAPEDLEQFAPIENRRVLRKSYRIPRNVHATAVALAREQLDHWGIEFAPRECDGEVARGADQDSLVDRALDRGGTSMIVASCSYMLHGILRELRTRGAAFSNPWRPARPDWNPISGSRARKVLDYLKGDQRDVRRMDWMLDLRAEALTRGTKAKLKEGKIDTPRDFHEWCALFRSEADAIKALGERDPSWFLDNIAMKLREAYAYLFRVGAKRLAEPPKLFVGTIHSVKGGEADHVFVLPDVSAQAWQNQLEVEGGRADLIRTFYVGVTRARETLTVCKAINGMEMSI